MCKEIENAEIIILEEKLRDTRFQLQKYIVYDKVNNTIRSLERAKTYLIAIAVTQHEDTELANKIISILTSPISENILNSIQDLKQTIPDILKGRIK